MATKKLTHPKYKVCQWLDTSSAALEQEQATIYYGIQTQLKPKAPWMHCHRNGDPLLFATPALASEAIEALRQRDLSR